MRSTNGSFRGGTEHEQMVAVYVVRLVRGKENRNDCVIQGCDIQKWKIPYHNTLTVYLVSALEIVQLKDKDLPDAK